MIAVSFFLALFIFLPVFLMAYLASREKKFELSLEGFEFWAFGEECLNEKDELYVLGRWNAKHPEHLFSMGDKLDESLDLMIQHYEEEKKGFRLK